MYPINSSNGNIDFSIIIVNYNLAKEIENCLNSFFENIDTKGKIKYEIIIVDNASPDKGLYEIEKKFKSDNIHFFFLDENAGFGKGCNFGSTKATGKYFCFLNPDTLLKDDIFPSIIELFENDKSIGIIGPKQQVKSNSFDFSAGFSPNVLLELFNLFCVGFFVEGFFMSVYTKIKKGNMLKVNWILGAAIFIKADLFNKINGFDKDYFMFFEEVDLCKRVANLGLNIIYCPNFKIHHIGSVSGKKDYGLYTIRTYSSKYIYLSKHYTAFKKYVMQSLLFMQVFSQILIWTFLFPANKEKSKQKLNGFLYLLKHKMKYEHRY